MPSSQNVATFCYHHRSVRVSQSPKVICSRCKSCRHSAYWVKDGIYHCCFCYHKTDQKPTNSKIFSYERTGKWEELK